MYNNLMIMFLAARWPFFSGSYVMAPFPQVMLRVRFRRQQFFKDVICTVPNDLATSRTSRTVKKSSRFNVLLQSFTWPDKQTDG